MTKPPYDVEIASIRTEAGRMVWELGFCIPRFKFLRFEKWQFFEQRTLMWSKDQGGWKLSHYKTAMVFMKEQIEEWIAIIDRAIEKYGDMEPE